MLRMKWKLVGLVLLSVLGSCASKEDETPDNEILGRWEWVKTENPSAVNYYEILQTPENTGNQVVQEYFNDGGLVIIKNDTISQSARYKFSSNNVLFVYKLSDTTVYDVFIKGEYMVLTEYPDLVAQQTYARPGIER